MSTAQSEAKPSLRSAIKQLEDVLVSFDYHNPRALLDHKEIYTHIQQNIISSPALDHGPNLSIIVYGIKSHLYPVLATCDLFSLLNHIARVESHRRRAHSIAERALTWNTYYKTQNAKSAICLTEEEEQHLQTIVDRDQSWRRVYITLLAQGCCIDIFQAWTAEPLSVSAIIRKFDQLFSGIDQGDPVSSFVKSLKPEERVAISDSKQACCRFFRDFACWARASGQQKRGLRNSCTSETFYLEFLKQCDVQSFERLLTKYLAFVEGLVKDLQTLFPKPDP